VVNFFMVGSERFTWELVSVDKSESCRLSISHTGGTIVEYFTNATAALQRQQELESLLTGVPAARRGASR
jgi:L-asparaginase/Glu-tRNA(Gln) amidotransferase subunit D